MATIVEVAEQAGIGVGTVSPVLHTTGRAWQTARARILAATHELDSWPNQAAFRPVTTRCSTIRGILPHLTRPFFPEPKDR